MFRPDFEPTLAEMMRDPIVRALMRADRVDAAAFEAKLRGFAPARRREPAASPLEDSRGARRKLPLVPGFERAVGAAHHCWC